MVTAGRQWQLSERFLEEAFVDDDLAISVWKTDVCAYFGMNRRIFSLVACVLGCGVLLTWAQYDVNSINAAHKAAVDRINQRLQEVRTLSARTTGSEFLRVR